MMPMLDRWTARRRNDVSRGAAVAAILLLVGCTDPEATTDPEHTAESHEVDAIVVAWQFGGEALLVRHEEIPGRMDAMQMAFRVADSLRDRPLAPGDTVRLDVSFGSGSPVVVGIGPVPPGTTLDVPAEAAAGEE